MRIVRKTPITLLTISLLFAALVIAVHPVRLYATDHLPMAMDAAVSKLGTDTAVSKLGLDAVGASRINTTIVGSVDVPETIPMPDGIGIPDAAEAPDVNSPVTLKLHFEHNGEPIESVPLKLYRLAVYNPDGELVCEPRFSQYEIMTILDKVSISSAALTLEGYVGMDMLKPDILVETSPEGVAEVKDGLVQGLYLVLGGIREQGENRYLPAPIIISLPSFDEASGQWLYDVEAMAKFEVESTSIKDRTRSPIKIWRDDDDEAKHRPDYVEVVLIQDDSTIEDSIRLSIENDWRFEWNGLDASHKWTVAERQVLRYIAAVEQVGDYFSIINIYGGGDRPTNINPPLESTEAPETPDEPETPQTDEQPSTEPPTGDGGTMERPPDNGGGMLPKTGQLWWPVLVLGVVGVCFILIGISRRR